MIRQGFVQSDQFLKDLVKFNIYLENPNAIQDLNSMLLDLGIPKSTNPLAPKNVILQQANNWAEYNELPIKFLNIHNWESFVDGRDLSPVWKIIIDEGVTKLNNLLNEMGALFEEDGKGDCFEVAGRAMIDLTEEQEMYGMKLVHAFVRGQGELEGRRFEHAWNEQGDVVLDNSNGNNVVLRKEQYYKLGGIEVEAGAYATYNKDDTMINMLKHGHYGPWDLNDDLQEGK